jgi:prefoldin subunit 5
MAEPDLEFLAEQMRRIQAQMGSLADDMRVMTAMLMRLDHGQANLLEEMRAVHQQIARLADQVGRLEGERKPH